MASRSNLAVLTGDEANDLGEPWVREQRVDRGVFALELLVAEGGVDRAVTVLADGLGDASPTRTRDEVMVGRIAVGTRAERARVRLVRLIAQLAHREGVFHRSFEGEAAPGALGLAPERL